MPYQLPAHVCSINFKLTEFLVQSGWELSILVRRGNFSLRDTKGLLGRPSFTKTAELRREKENFRMRIPLGMVRTLFPTESK